jgi:hypothetical protein
MLIGVVNDICSVHIAVGRQVKNKIFVQREAVAVAGAVGGSNVDLGGRERGGVSVCKRPGLAFGEKECRTKRKWGAGCRSNAGRNTDVYM